MIARELGNYYRAVAKLNDMLADFEKFIAEIPARSRAARRGAHRRSAKKRRADR
jgi:hypothetical protein